MLWQLQEINTHGNELFWDVARKLEKMNQMEILDLKHTIAEIKSTMEGLNNKLAAREDRQSAFEDR